MHTHACTCTMCTQMHACTHAQTHRCTYISTALSPQTSSQEKTVPQTSESQTFSHKIPWRLQIKGAGFSKHENQCWGGEGIGKATNAGPGHHHFLSKLSQGASQCLSPHQLPALGTGQGQFLCPGSPRWLQISSDVTRLPLFIQSAWERKSSKWKH